MALDQHTVQTMADDYTAAWNSGSADAVASFYAEDGSIVINHGSPWQGGSGVAQMAAGFFAVTRLVRRRRLCAADIE